MTRAMNHGDDLNRFLLPGVANHVRVEIPEAISAIQEFFVKVADTRRLSQGLQRFIISGSETFSGIGAIRCDIQEDLRQVGPCFWRKPKPPFHTRVAFFFTRLRSAISRRNSSNTWSASSRSPLSA